MPFYDYFDTEERTITRIGRMIVWREITAHIQMIRQYRKTTGRLKVLEIGPGKGYFAKSALENGWDYTGIDGSATLVSRLKGYNIPVTLAHVPPIPESAGGDYDAIVMEQLLEHMSTVREATTVVEDAYSRLVKGGVLLIASPDYKAQGAHFFDCDYTHNYVTTTRRVSQLLIDSGFTIAYKGYETLSISSEFATLLITMMTRILYASGIPAIIGKLLNKEERMSKIKFTLLRSCVVVGRK
ncbi:MAG: class I SAM-dependent methyltransferase [Anaerolineae bacterium]|nr:class I SAM-dependent methyltransferase [Anaerolineae bacterium]